MGRTHHSMARGMRLVVFASDLAGCIGRNKYHDRAELKLAYLKRISPESYEFASSCRKGAGQAPLLREERVDAAMAALKVADAVAHARLSHLGEEAARLARETMYATGLHSTVDSALEALQACPALDAASRAALEEHCVRTANTSLGTHAEVEVAKRITEEAGEGGGGFAKDERFVMRRVCDAFTNDGRLVPVYVGGKCDGVRTDASGTRTIVEIKNRVKRLFNRQVDYERIQLLAYLFVYRCPAGTLVERFQDQRREHPLAFSDEAWAEVVGGLRTFAQEVTDMVIAEEGEHPFSDD
jgi:hypothetical protein